MPYQCCYENVIIVHISCCFGLNHGGACFHKWAKIVLSHISYVILYHDFVLLCGMHHRWYTGQNCSWEGWNFQGGYNSCISNIITVHSLFCNLAILFMVASSFLFIFQLRVPAFTVPQPDEAMRVLEEKASELDVRWILITEFYGH